MSVFSDLNVSCLSDVKRLQSILETAAHLGYSTIAINHIADFQEKKKEIDKPVCPSELFPSLPIVQGKSKPIKVVTRLTLIVSDPSHCNVLRSTSPRTKLYDIVAVFPKTEKLFHAACTSLDVDLICINVTEKQPFYFRRPPINVAIERGVFFELVYTPAIKDSTMRRYTISNALSLMQICKGKECQLHAFPLFQNVIISSSAERPLELRGPYDVAALYPFLNYCETVNKTPNLNELASRPFLYSWGSIRPLSVFKGKCWKITENYKGIWVWKSGNFPKITVLTSTQCSCT
uniref:Ribonuclease P protein subunit p30 n=1 Tax=Geotrypetes seraphini TaxID=260995 RepID=A0A6P8QKP2_GEOSA|nr:ribonuclease P protein subunit p30 isoform X2 [Geotrypetes seraphini]